ncbi:HEAT repeat domain-containing protein [Paludisphaera mucosa]|uniref:HEAT repeat domain-containing protein n=1 Tax=Paludisphaera mucosa TaxID=3030827 RepID=A0ABT6FFM0_9BACT|nr:HEAT repeat domain-containing protein [Paludisphaera mucosa]MDG3006354.1 HEAT repeat domain-containing protein [Paludisphaera mucosa]
MLPPSVLRGLIVATLSALVLFAARRPVRGDDAVRADASIASGEIRTRPLGDLTHGRRYELVVSLAAPASDDRLAVELIGPDGPVLRKDLHSGDPDVYLAYRPTQDGLATLRLTRSKAVATAPALQVSLSWRGDGLSEDDHAALESEPNDEWGSANRLVLGRTVYGSADDVEFLDNREEGRSGLDWFRFEVESEKPVLVTFTLDLIDRDVSADLRIFTVEDGRPKVYSAGKDPMEIVHDRERERYSKNLVRTFTKGVYYLRVNANHPAYILRTRMAEVPPYDDPAKAVEAGLHYILNAGDAWLAQVPREGNRFVRAANLHETSLRCTGCHATSFPAEAALAAHRAGYPIHAKDALSYLVERIADSPAPLYGDAGLFWQRYIATPLEAQGAQGGVLVDFDREVAGADTAALARFGPFLRAAWASRTTLPEDEHNVVPAESKFGLAWRGWKTLTEVARRTGRAEDARAAANIAAILGSRQADKQVETLQDRIHRLVAWSLIDRQAHANKIRRETGALLTLQNADGGWHESDSKPGPSAVYTTGQIVDALLEAGLTRENPAVDRALKYLLSQQQEFGGWFQADTHENFRTPMRETRYAVMALARAFPRADGPRLGWANRGHGPPSPPRTSSVVHAIDDLEALWDVPPAERPRFASAVGPLLDHPSPLVRASAAACLGRLNCVEGVKPLAKALGDPSKVVRRAAAFAFRQLGNRGIGVEAIASALDATDPRVRRAAVSLFTGPIHGLDDRRELVNRLIARADDPDLLTRFEAARALRRWFYRTPDPALRRRIVEAVLARMAVEEVPLHRTNLSENLYIMLDENLGGGVSLQRNLAALPESMRGPILEGRRKVERDVLLAPILAALRSGGEPRREGILRAFDGSFFRGRTYARQPEGAVDVGNDREFGFLYEVPLDELEAVFAVLLDAPRAGSGGRQALQLASFFKVPERTRNASIQAAVLRALDDGDAEIRVEARRIASGMSFEGAEDDPARTRAIARGVTESAESRPALIAAIGRNPRLAGRPEIARATAALATRLDGEPELLPLLDRPGVADADVVAAINRGWAGYDPARKAEAIRMVLRRPDVGGDAAASRPLLDLLRLAAGDPSETIREQAFSAFVVRVPATSVEASPTILLALADASPKIRRLGLAATSQRASFWDRADVLERLARLLIDPDAGVRSDALAIVKHHRLLVRFPVLAHRLKVLIAEPALTARVEALFRASGLDPATTAADVAVDRPVFLSLESFRRSVNSLLYKAGPDGHACVDCHANHAILRVAEAREGGPTEEDVAANFASASKVVDLGRPEASLLLRKPRSPVGQGEADATSPTGLTHVGGPRWGGLDDPAHRAVLAWIRAAAAQTEDVPPIDPGEIEDLSVAPPR